MEGRGNEQKTPKREKTLMDNSGVVGGGGRRVGRDEGWCGGINGDGRLDGVVSPMQCTDDMAICCGTVHLRPLQFC